MVLIGLTVCVERVGCEGGLRGWIEWMDER